VRELAELVGPAASSETDHSYLAFAEPFEQDLLDQRPDEERSLDETATHRRMRCVGRRSGATWCR
jgi:vacuolar-type H+-ATPase subunit B/Vma2